MSRHQTVEVQASSTASPEEVWRLLEDVTTWPAWARFDEAAYERTGSPAPHGVGAVRKMRAGPLHARDTVVHFEPPRQLSYTYVGSLPVDDYRADVTLTPYDGGTRITWHAEFVARRPLTGRLMRAVIAKVLDDVASRLSRAAALPTTGVHEMASADE